MSVRGKSFVLITIAAVTLAVFISFMPGISHGVPVRKPAVAGSFYPSDPAKLRKMIADFTGKVNKKGITLPQGKKLRAIVMPHAGYPYSGPTAAYVSLVLEPGMFDRIIIIGPDHRVGFRNAAVTDASFFETPLGMVKIDPAASVLRRRQDLFRAVPESDRTEHSVEALVPFLQTYLGNFTLVPIVAGPCNPDVMAKVLSPLLTDKTLLAISSDLSHYLPYSQAVKRDHETVNAIINLDMKTLLSGENRACGIYPLEILLTIADGRGWKPVLLHYENSGDSSGEKNRVVGYSAIAFFSDEPAKTSQPVAATGTVSLTEEEGTALTVLARAVIAARLDHTDELSIPQAVTVLLKTPVLDEKHGTFVTLTKNGVLRGCMGTIKPVESIREGVKKNALNAAFRDPRFPPLTKKELPEIDIEVSILTNPKPLDYSGPLDLVSKLERGKDGVIISKGFSGATYLPQVWQQLPDPEDFLSHLCRKAGMSADAWKKDKLKVETYRVRYFDERKQ